MIAPKLVLTAKHCVDDGTFNYGPSEHQRVGVVQKITSTVNSGGFLGLGLDMMVLKLERAITDVRPLKVLSAPLSQTFVGERFGAVGSGGALDLGHVSRHKGRHIGTVTLRVTQGNPFLQLFGSEDGIYDALIRWNRGTGDESRMRDRARYAAG